MEKINPVKKLIEELFNDVPERGRCEYIRRDNAGPYCAKNLKGWISDTRRMICDTASLQLWCLDREKCGKCIYYQGERID